MIKIPDSCFIADSAVISGDVTMGEDCSIYFNASLRGDEGAIVLGDRCNIQDNCVLHTNTVLGNDVTVGHSAIVHGCTIGDRVLVGIGAIIMSGAVIGESCIIGAGALITEKKVIPPGSIVMGAPAKITGTVNEMQAARPAKTAKHYADLGKRYKNGEIEMYKK